MSYTAPTYDASGQTSAQLQTRGFVAHVRTLVSSLTTETPTAEANQLVNQLLESTQALWPLARAADVVDNYTNGQSDKTNAKAQIYNLQLAYGCVAAALGEIGVLIDAN